MDNAGEEINMGNKAVTQGISIRLGGLRDVELIHKLKYQAFLPLYEKYHDDETSPARESLEKVIDQLKQDDTEYYLISSGSNEVGAVRIKHKGKGVYTISPVFVIPEFHNKGIAGKVLEKMFDIYPEAVAWRLETVLEEVGNCHLYERLGFVATGNMKYINDNMTLIEYEKVI